jgi:Protein of unknown function (DUF2586)
MALPGVTPTVRDGALGTTTPGAGSVHLKLGPAPFGVVNTIYPVTDNTTLTAALGRGGALPEAAAVALAYPGVDAPPGNQIYCVPINPSTYGTASAVTHVGPGTGTMTVAPKPGQQFQIKIITGGSTATATFQLSYDAAGLVWGATTTTAATVQMPGASFVTLGFGAGSAVTGDTYTISTTGTVTPGGGNTGTLAVTFSSASPYDAYTAVVTITTAGALGVAQYTITLDGNNTVQGPLLVPASGTVVVADTGLVLTFSGTFTANDTYSFTTTGPSYAGADFTNAMTAILASPLSWAFMHLIGQASSSANAATLFATVDSQMTTAANAFRYVSCVYEWPQDTDANLISNSAALASGRVNTCAGFLYTISPINGRAMSRSLGWHVAARGSKVAASTDVGRVKDGSLSQIPGALASGAAVASRNESATPGLDAARFTTATSYVGRSGWYITQGRIMATQGSDFSSWVNRRVMDVATPAGRTELLNLVNDTVFVNPDGTINEGSAKQIETRVSRAEEAALVQQNPQLATSVTATVSRTQNVLSTQTLPVTIRVLPLGYTRYITEDIGFANPNLVQAGSRT